MRGRLEAELAQQAAARQARLLSQDGLSPLPPGFRPEDVVEQSDGFVPLEQAAERMGIDQEQLLELIRTGRIEAERRDGVVLARPALVRVIGMRVIR